MVKKKMLFLVEIFEWRLLPLLYIVSYGELVPYSGRFSTYDLAEQKHSEDH